MSACDFGPGDTERVHLIMGEWQVISDIAQSDLVLWFPTDYVVADGSSPDAVSGPSATSTFRAFAHVRPSNVRTLFHHDIIECDTESATKHTASGLTRTSAPTPTKEAVKVLAPARV